MSLRAIVALSTLVGCAPGGDGSNNADLPIPGGVAAECGDAAPVINELRVQDGGEQVFQGGTYPSLIVRADVSDADEDLHYYTMRVWWDDLFDGAVSPEGTYFELYGTINATACEVPRTTFSMQIGLTGNPPADEDIEIGVVVWDDMEHPSNEGVPVVVETHTPG